jgi:uncharacterized protein (TIGR00251 family)
LAAWTVLRSGARVHLRVTPNAGVDRIEGTETRDDGTAVLRIRVAAVADRGKANAAVIALLSKSLRVPKSAIAIVAGETARFKTVEIAGDSDRLAAALEALVG